MMIELKQLYEATVNLVENIEAVNIDELIELVEQRECVIDLIKLEKNLSPAHKEMLSKISDYDQLIHSRMISLKDEAAQALSNISKSRIHKHKYEPQFTGESYFVDRRE